MIAYFLKKLKPAETKYSTFDRKLLAVYLMIKHFCDFIEGWQFSLFTDHKPLTFSLSTHSDHHTPRQIHHLDYISQFTTIIHCISGHSNPVADALSCIKLNAVISPFQSPVIDIKELAATQQQDSQLQELTQGNSSLSLKPVPEKPHMLHYFVIHQWECPAHIILSFIQLFLIYYICWNKSYIEKTGNCTFHLAKYQLMFTNGHDPICSANVLKYTDIQ